MKKFILLLILFSTFGAAQVPQEINTQIITKIDQEAKNTRTFFSQELSRQRNEFYADFDDRANYYEMVFTDTMRSTVITLSLVWAGVVLTIVGINNYLAMRLERRRFERIIQSIREQLAAPQPAESTPKEEPTNDRYKFDFVTEAS